MNNIIYCHEHIDCWDTKFTLALDVTPVIKLDGILNRHLGLNLGYSVCSSDDTFNKKIGRELAVSRIDLREVQVYNIKMVGHHTVLSCVYVVDDRRELAFHLKGEYNPIFNSLEKVRILAP